MTILEIMKRIPTIHYRIALVLASFLMMGKACEPDVTDPKAAAALTEINAAWRSGYQEVLQDFGTRYFAVERPFAMVNMRRVLESMGFTVVNSEANYYLYVTGPADTPFTKKEWKHARSLDEPLMKDVASRHVGRLKASFIGLYAEGLEIHGRVTFLERGDGTDITITFRLVEIKPQPPESILPRREYPPPGAVRIVFKKIWRLFEKQALPIARMQKE